MKVFLSWSGERSRLVAEAAKQWLLDNFHMVQPWISTHDIQSGAVWMPSINEQLSDTGIGIVFLTKENKNKPWLLFEAGALAKGLSTNRVCTFLIDLEPADITDPLAQFNHTTPTNEGLLRLLQTINLNLGTGKRDQESLNRTHRRFTPDFMESIQSAKRSTQTPPDTAIASDNDLLRQLIEMQRATANRIAGIEKQLSQNQESRSLQLGIGALNRLASYDNILSDRSLANILNPTISEIRFAENKGDFPGGTSNPKDPTGS